MLLAKSSYFCSITNKDVYLHNGNEKERYGKTSKNSYGNFRNKRL